MHDPYLDRPSNQQREETATRFRAEFEATANYEILQLMKQEEDPGELSFQLDKDEESLVEDLDTVGIEIDSVWDLVNTNAKYPEAIPVLLHHLIDVHHHIRTQEGIIRSLIVKESFPTAFDPLCELFHSGRYAEEREELPWLLASAIVASASKDDWPIIASLIEQPSSEITRKELARAIKHVKGDNKSELRSRWINRKDLLKLLR